MCRAVFTGSFWGAVGAGRLVSEEHAPSTRICPAGQPVVGDVMLGFGTGAGGRTAAAGARAPALAAGTRLSVLSGAVLGASDAVCSIASMTITAASEPVRWPAAAAPGTALSINKTASSTGEDAAVRAIVLAMPTATTAIDPPIISARWSARGRSRVPRNRVASSMETVRPAAAGNGGGGAGGGASSRGGVTPDSRSAGCRSCDASRASAPASSEALAKR